MAANNILAYAQGGGANVLSQADYLADAQRPIGNQPGIARSAFVNKALRQAIVMARGLAQFLADNQGTDVDDTLLEAAISTMMSNAVKASASSPPGTIVFVPAISPLPNTLKINGALISRATYSRLYTFAAASGNISATDAAWLSGGFSPGDGTTTFRLPDYRGYSLRMWDDGRGIDVGRTIGSVQADQLLQHTHGVTDPTHTHGVTDPTHAHYWGTNNQQQNAGGNGNLGGQGSQVGALSAPAATGISINAAGTGISIQNSSGGAEVRVKNIALLPLIYY